MIRCADCGRVDYHLDSDRRCYECAKFYLQDSDPKPEEPARATPT